MTTKRHGGELRGGNGGRRSSMWIAVVISVGVVALLGAAWQDAGRQPVRDVVVPVAVPELPR